MSDRGGVGDEAVSDAERAGPPVGEPAIAAAAQRVVMRWRSELGDVEDADELRHEVALVAAAVADPSAEMPAASALRKRALDLLRGELLGGADPAGVDAAATLDLMRRCERLREAWDAEWSAHFSSRLSEPDGLDLAVDIAHDLRSPLASVLFLAEVLWQEHSGEVNATQKRQLGIIYSAALRLISMASDIIELARGGNLIEPEPVPFSLGELLSSLHDIVRPMAEEKGLTVRMSAPEGDLRSGQPAALRRVLLNLASNSLKFTEEGYVEVVAAEADDGLVRFSVRDTGPGIPDEVQRRLFQPFRRVRGRRGYTFSGAGLGLAASRKLVEAMGGELDVESRPEWGTRFRFAVVLPAVDSPVPVGAGGVQDVTRGDA
ncbi:MAG: HAMP domain-containing sensor histidine kinase [Gemmatimonadota bacterium]